MSSSDSGIIIVALPVVVTIGAVSLAAAGISALAEKYRSSRLEKAEAEEAQKKSELQKINAIAEKNQAEYENIIHERICEESRRKSSESRIKDAARRQHFEELQAREILEEKIRSQIENMDREVQSFEKELGQEQKIREMCDTIHQSEKMFGYSKQLLQDIEDFVYVILPETAKEKRKDMRTAKIDRRLARIEVESFQISDTSEKFVSLFIGDDGSKVEEFRTPWDNFMERIYAVVAVEAAYYESEASELLNKAKAIAPASRNFFVQQNQIRLGELEDRSMEYKNQQKLLFEQKLDDLYLYLSISKKLGLEPRYSKENLKNSYLVADMREETARLIEEYKKRKERQYVTNALTVVMKRHNLTFENMDVGEDGITHIEYSIDKQTGVRITRSEFGAFEMQFQGKSKGESASMDEKRTILEKAKHFCHILPTITEELEKEFGISFEQTSLQPPDIENIEIRKDRSLTRNERVKVLKTKNLK